MGEVTTQLGAIGVIATAIVCAEHLTVEHQQALIIPSADGKSGKLRMVADQTFKRPPRAQPAP